MEKNGWTIDVEHSNLDDSDADNNEHRCGTETFYGWKKDPPAKVSTTFMGYGEAKLSFGNCYTRGVVVATLNNNELSRASGYKKNVAISFNYKKGDVLMLKDYEGIIKLNYLKLECGGKLFGTFTALIIFRNLLLYWH